MLTSFKVFVDCVDILAVFVSIERECDLDKHCGVLDPDRKKVCTRLLTCNVSSKHTMLHKTNVPLILPQMVLPVHVFILLLSLFSFQFLFSL